MERSRTGEKRGGCCVSVYVKMSCRILMAPRDGEGRVIFDRRLELERTRELGRTRVELLEVWLGVHGVVNEDTGVFDYF